MRAGRGDLFEAVVTELPERVYRVRRDGRARGLVGSGRRAALAPRARRRRSQRTRAPRARRRGRAAADGRGGGRRRPARGARDRDPRRRGRRGAADHAVRTAHGRRRARVRPRRHVGAVSRTGRRAAVTGDAGAVRGRLARHAPADARLPPRVLRGRRRQRSQRLGSRRGRRTPVHAYLHLAAGRYPPPARGRPAGARVPIAELGRRGRGIAGRAGDRAGRRHPALGGVGARHRAPVRHHRHRLRAGGMPRSTRNGDLRIPGPAGTPRAVALRRVHRPRDARGERARA